MTEKDKCDSCKRDDVHLISVTGHPEYHDGMYCEKCNPYNKRAMYDVAYVSELQAENERLVKERDVWKSVAGKNQQDWINASNACQQFSDEFHKLCARIEGSPKVWEHSKDIHMNGNSHYMCTWEPVKSHCKQYHLVPVEPAEEQKDNWKREQIGKWDDPEEGKSVADMRKERGISSEGCTCNYDEVESGKRVLSDIEDSK